MIEPPAHLIPLDDPWKGEADHGLVGLLAVQYEFPQTKVKRLIEALQPYEPEEVYLFGSWARGEEDDLSDMDIVVIKRTQVAFFDRLREVQRLLPAGLGGIDVLVYTPDEFAAMRENGNAFAEMIVEEGRLIYGG